MEGGKLGAKDRKILYFLQDNARISLTALAKKVGISKQVAKYRIENLEKQRIILGYSTLIDFSKLNKTVFIVNLDLMNITDKYLTSWITQLKNNPDVISFIRNSGKYDISISIIAKDNVEFDKIFKSITKNRNTKIRNQMISAQIESYIVPFDIIKSTTKKIEIKIGGEKSDEKIDELDKKLIDHLIKNAKTPSLELSRIFKTSPNTIKNRITALQKKGIIRTFKTDINYDLIGYDQYKTYIFLKNYNEETFIKIKNFLINLPSVNTISKCSGYSDIEYKCYVEDVIDLYKLNNKLKDNFKEEIKDIEPLQAFCI